ncbi:hypothetical protein CPU09_13850, partial [Mammaliicoccus sciuri]|uniref:LPXTG cell wall anchor domain-containing protein n=1 Tax=Mammaliicoccus sciuri TaxID=1296 RepID=UPI000BD70A08
AFDHIRNYKGTASEGKVDSPDQVKDTVKEIEGNGSNMDPAVKTGLKAIKADGYEVDEETKTALDRIKAANYQETSAPSFSSSNIQKNNKEDNVSYGKENSYNNMNIGNGLPNTGVVNLYNLRMISVLLLGLGLLLLIAKKRNVKE